MVINAFGLIIFLVNMVILLIYFVGPSTQLGDITSGVQVSALVNFPVNHPAMSPVAINPFTLIDDATALELNEQYQIGFTGSSITDNVNLGPNTTITIQDDDGEFFCGS